MKFFLIFFLFLTGCHHFKWDKSLDNGKLQWKGEERLKDMTALLYDIREMMAYSLCNRVSRKAKKIGKYTLPAFDRGKCIDSYMEHFKEVSLKQQEVSNE